MRQLLRKAYWILSVQFGLDVRRMFLSFRGLPRFFADWINFRRSYNGEIRLLPCLYDWREEGGATRSEYFWQDLYVAQKVFKANPRRHVDIGSRIDGFVAHVASFRQIEVFDIRPITSDIPGVIFKQADLMNLSEKLTEYCDSLSCLHALEHFGLGRYGDPVDPYGYMSGLAHMAGMLRAGGLFYLSIPIGKERIEFNAHRVFDPRSIVRLAEANDLILREFAWIESSQYIVQSTCPMEDMDRLSRLDYVLGIFTFVKQ